MRSLYNQRRQTLVQALLNYFGEQVTILGENAGMHLMVRLSTSLSNEAVISRAAAMGVGLVSARRYYLENGCSGEFILGYADLRASQIEAGVQRKSDRTKQLALPRSWLKVWIAAASLLNLIQLKSEELIKLKQ